MTPAAGSPTHHWLGQQRVHPDADVSRVLPIEIDALGARRVFLLTTRSLADSAIVQRTRDAIAGRLCGVFDGIAAHTPAEDVAQAARAVQACAADLIVAVGGGSVIDASKLLSYAVRERLFSREDLLAGLPAGLQGSDWATIPRSPGTIAIPTTLSAAEFTTHAGITDTANGRKHVVLHPSMIPRVVILDPRATLETPQRLFLASGVRAVDHAVERLCSVRAAPFSDAVSRQALQMLAAALPDIHARPDVLVSRAAAQYGAWLSIMGGWAGVPVGASHGLGYILGAYNGIPHGETSCLMLHAVLRWNEVVDTGRQSHVAQWLGRPGSAADAVSDFVAALGLPTRLSQVGIDAAQFPEIAARYDGAGPIATNPRPVRGAADLVDILELAR